MTDGEMKQIAARLEAAQAVMVHVFRRLHADEQRLGDYQRAWNVGDHERLADTLNPLIGGLKPPPHAAVEPIVPEPLDQEKIQARLSAVKSIVLFLLSRLGADEQDVTAMHREWHAGDMVRIHAALNSILPKLKPPVRRSR